MCVSSCDIGRTGGKHRRGENGSRIIPAILHAPDAIVFLVIAQIKYDLRVRLKVNRRLSKSIHHRRERRRQLGFNQVPANLR
jgi:hypothetical protein